MEISKVLVTGAAGWLGKGLINALVNGIAGCDKLAVPVEGLDIRALVMPGEQQQLSAFTDNITIVEGNLTLTKDCQDFCKDCEDAVLIHLAGIVHPIKRVQEFYDVNVDGTKNIISAAVASKVKRAVVMSSNSPVGCNPHRNHRFDEQSPFNPYMNYGKSKQLMEMHIREIHQSQEIETTVIRAPWFYGPFQPARQIEFFKMVRDGKGPIVGDGENMRSMAYIDNLSQGLILAAITPRANGEVYWIADESPYTMNQIINTIERLLDTEFGQKCKYKRLRLPSVTSDIAWVVDGLIQKFGWYHQKIHVLSEMNKTIACSIGKAKKELGYRPTVALEEGMRRSLESAFGEAK